MNEEIVEKLEELDLESKILLSKLNELNDHFDNVTENVENISTVFERVKKSFDSYKHIVDLINEKEDSA